MAYGTMFTFAPVNGVTPTNHNAKMADFNYYGAKNDTLKWHFEYMGLCF